MNCHCAHHKAAVPAPLAIRAAGRPLLPDNLRDVMVAYTSSKEPSVKAWAREMWGKMASDLTQAEVQAIIDMGGLTLPVAARNNALLDELLAKIEPRWSDTMRAAASLLPPNTRELLTAEVIQEWAKRRREVVLSGFTDAQNRSIRALIDHHSAVQPLDQRALAAILRPAMGLTEKQTTHLIKLRAQFAAEGSTGDTLDLRTTRAASALQRKRAEMVARTELASAWNGGVQVTMERAVEAGAFEGKVVKVWRAQRGKVCPICASLNGRSTPIKTPFDAAFDIAPAHPGCRCVITYEEVR